MALLQFYFRLLNNNALEQLFTGREIILFAKSETMVASCLFRCGGDTASTWVLKHQEHSEAHRDLVKNVHFVIGNDYALAA